MHVYILCVHALIAVGPPVPGDGGLWLHQRDVFQQLHQVARARAQPEARRQGAWYVVHWNGGMEWYSGMEIRLSKPRLKEFLLRKEDRKKKKDYCDM